MKTPYIQRGDYVKALTGHFKGKRGWVARTMYESACVCWKGVWEHGIWVSLSELKRTKRIAPKEQREQREQYSIPDNSDFGGFDDEKNIGYEVSGSGNSIKEFLDEVTVSEIDQDGGEVRCYGFDDAPLSIQNRILNYVNLSWKDVQDAN